MKKIYKIVSLSLASVLWMGFFQLPEDESPQVGSAVSAGVQKSGAPSNANIEVAHEVKKIKGGDPNYAHICIVLDASGSMAPYQEDMISACHNFLRTQRDIPGEETLDIWTFSGSQGIQKIVDFKRLDRKHYLKDYMCAGGTPCFDAMLTAMKDLSKRINAKSIKPGVVIFVFITDGLDNASQYSASDVRKEIANHIDNWNFLFLGAGQWASNVGNDIGLPKENCFNVLLGSKKEIKLLWDAIERFSKRSRGVK